MRRIAITILAAVFTVATQAQKVTFSSPGIEAGVRYHLGLNADAEIPQSRTDTITAINLSGLGITDLRDIVYLPNVRTLDLSDNKITNVGPLNVLDSLRELNLSKNTLESINLLAFSNSEKMTVDVTYNYIVDFSYLFDCIKCQFTLIGMSRQRVKDAPYLDVYQLYADVEADEQLIVRYRGFTNMGDAPLMKCNDVQAAATLDGHLNSMTVPGTPTATSAVVLSCGELTDTTYVVPPVCFQALAEQTKTLGTGLPDDYRIGFASALHGSVTVDGLSLTYTASASGEDDTIFFSYYKGNQLKGFSQYFMSTDVEVPTPIQHVTGESPLKLTWQNGSLLVECAQSAMGGCAEATITVWNAAGQLLTTENVDASGGIDAVIHVSSQRGNVVIVQVDGCGKRIIGKCLLAQ